MLRQAAIRFAIPAQPRTGRPEALPQPALPPEPVSEGPARPAAPVEPCTPRRCRSRNCSSRSNPTRQRVRNLPRRPRPPLPLPRKSRSPRPGPRTNKNSGVPFDPIKENGPIFVDWPKPKLALVITGNQEGYLEPCGCAGLDRMKGGMSRRYCALSPASRDKYGWPVVGIDVGNIAKGFGKQAELKFQIAVNAMSEMRLQRGHARADRPAPAHRRGHGPDHAGRREQEDDVRLRQRRSVRLQREAAAADAVDRGRLQDDRRDGGAGKDLHGATGRQRRSEDDLAREATWTRPCPC